MSINLLEKSFSRSFRHVIVSKKNQNADPDGFLPPFLVGGPPDETEFCLGSFFHIMINYWLVVWHMFFIFSRIGNVIIPTDFHIFLRGGSTTNQYIYIMGKWLVLMSAGLCRKCWINVYAFTIHREYHAEYPTYDRFLRPKSWSSDGRIHLGLRDRLSTTVFYYWTHHPYHPVFKWHYPIGRSTPRSLK